MGVPPPPGFIDEYLPVFKAKNKRTTNCMKLKFARSIQRRKGSKFTTKVLEKMQMSGVTMILYLTSKDFTVCLAPSAPQLHYSKFRIDISDRFSIHSTTLPVIFLLPCSHVYKPFAVLKSSFWVKTFRIRLLTTTSLTPDSSNILFTTAAVADS